MPLALELGSKVLIAPKNCWPWRGSFFQFTPLTSVARRIYPISKSCGLRDIQKNTLENIKYFARKAFNENVFEFSVLF